MEYVLIGLAALLVTTGVIFYNMLVAKRQMVENGWADIDVQLKRRADLIPNLVDVVKGYASHERNVLNEVIERRNQALSADQGAGREAAESAVSQGLSRLFALAEAYPDLKANTNFLQLQSELSAIEDKLAAARRFYNSAVQDYNTSREQFPGSIVAGMFNFEGREFFDVGVEGREALSTVPEVKF